MTLKNQLLSVLALTHSLPPGVAAASCGAPSASREALSVSYGAPSDSHGAISVTFQAHSASCETLGASFAFANFELGHPRL